MQVLLVEIRIHAPFVPAFEAAIVENARATREEPGCRQFDVCRDPADAARFLLYELYDDQAAIDAHLRSPHFLSMDHATREWVVTKTVRRLTRTRP
jgi:autoinducer 2-degrading protein